MRARRAAASVAAAAAVGGAGLAAGAAGLAEPGATTGTTGTTPGDPRVGQLEQELASSRRRERRMRRRAYAFKLAARRLRHAFRLEVRLGGASGLERGLLCIHRHEGSWADTGDPYWGGLQMDGSFMRAYGREFLRAFGPASSWTPAMQLATAERAYLSGRGFGPWPNTRRSCGL